MSSSRDRDLRLHYPRSGSRGYLGLGARRAKAPLRALGPQLGSTGGALPRLLLREGRERSVLRGHPWIFSGSIQRLEGQADSGDSVAVCSAQGVFLAIAAYSPESQIRARIWTRDAAVAVDDAFLGERVHKAVARRAALLVPGTDDACRLVHGEADGIPGFVADRYGDVIVAQVNAAGAERTRESLFTALVAATGCPVVYERSDADVRALEGLPPRAGVVHGVLAQPAVQIREHGLTYLVDVVAGQKTGFYLDQRDNRAAVARVAAGAEMLNCFCYSGAFTVAALAAGAKSALSIDSARAALELARENATLNGIDAARAQWVEADVFAELRALRAAQRRFDLVVLDPPKFAPSGAHAERAARAYKDINLLALGLLRPGGTLFTFSCSGAVDPDLFMKILAGAASDAGVETQVLARLQAAPDHPVMLSFPEGEYLKGLVLRRM